MTLWCDNCHSPCSFRVIDFELWSNSSRGKLLTSLSYLATKRKSSAEQISRKDLNWVCVFNVFQSVTRTAVVLENFCQADINFPFFRNCFFYFQVILCDGEFAGHVGASTWLFDVAKGSRRPGHSALCPSKGQLPMLFVWRDSNND